MDMTTAKADLSPMTANLKQAVDALRAGKAILLLDAHDRENEGDLVFAAEKITPESINFLIKQGSGVVCLAMPKERLDELALPLMSSDNTNSFKTAFTVSIEAAHGVTTGVSAKDRAHTISVAIADHATSTDLARPGHVFPLAAKSNGVFARMGHTEGSVDLMRIASLRPGAVLCELMNKDGSMTVGEDRIKFANEFDIPVVSNEEILIYRMQSEKVFERKSRPLSARFGDFSWHHFCFTDGVDVHVFHKRSWQANPQESAKVMVCPGDNLPMRFITQMFERSIDDPMYAGLSGIESGDSDIVVMPILNDELSGKPSSEVALRVNAAICTALGDVDVKAARFLPGDRDLMRIASHYFAIKAS